MSGKRVYISEALRYLWLRPGEYTARAGDWYAVLPNAQFVRLTDHQVTEHADGTISAEQPICAAGGAFTLVAGTWREAA